MRSAYAICWRNLVAFEHGLYALHFTTPLGEGSGVAYLQDGKLRGGDSTIAYVGSYHVDGGQLHATVLTYKYASVPGMGSVLGVDKAEIVLTGTVSGPSITLMGSTKQAPGITLQVKMQRLHN